MSGELITLARVYVPPYVRLRHGKRENVEGHWRELADVQAEIDSLGDAAPVALLHAVGRKVGDSDKTLDVPSTAFGMEYSPRSIRRADVQAAKKNAKEVFEALPTTDFPIPQPGSEMKSDFGALQATEALLVSRSINKVLAGEPLRSGYDPYILITEDEKAFVIDGHHRVAMYVGLGKDTMPAKVLDLRKSKEQPKEFKEALDSLPSDIRDRLEKFGVKYKTQEFQKGLPPAFYDTDEKTITINGTSARTKAVAIHELGHAYDDSLKNISWNGLWDIIPKKVRDRYQTLGRQMSHIGVGHGMKSGIKARDAAAQEIFADAFGALFGGETPMWWDENDPELADLIFIIKNAAAQIELARRVWIAPHERATPDGDVVHVNGYWRDMSLLSVLDYPDPEVTREDKTYSDSGEEKRVYKAMLNGSEVGYLRIKKHWYPGMCSTPHPSDVPCTEGPAAAKFRIDAIWTTPPFRRMGLAAHLYERALDDVGFIEHSEGVTDKGLEWAKAMGGVSVPDRSVYSWDDSTHPG